MTDVFISYAHEDQAFVRRIVPALESEGLSVWWDHTIPPGQTWDTFIARGIEEAKACIIIWSPHSIASDWVKEEATLAKDGLKYLPVQIGAEPPVGFRRIQAANLKNWTGDKSDPQWKMLVQEAARLAGGAPNRATSAAAAVATPPAPASAAKGGAFALMALAAIALVGGGYWLASSHRDEKPAATEEPAVAALPETAPAAPAAPEDKVAGTWRFETAKSDGCTLTGTLTSTPGSACKISAQWTCASFTQFAEESCTVKVDGDKVRVDSAVTSVRSNDGEKRAYYADSFNLTIAGEQMTGVLDDRHRSPAVTFTREN